MLNLKARIREGLVPVGPFLTDFGLPCVPPLLRGAGFDFAIYDNEHGCMSWESMATAIAVCRRVDLAAIVRVPKIDREPFQKAWDIGAQGVLVPMVDSPEQAAQAVRLSKYPPQGEKGVVPFRGNMDYDRRASLPDYLRESNEQGLVLLQIETPAGLERVEDILAVPGVDGIFVGPLDLSASMGCFMQMQHPDFLAAVQRCLGAAHRAGKIAASLVLSAAQAEQFLGMGMNFIAYGTDTGIFAAQAAALRAEIDGVLEG